MVHSAEFLPRSCDCRKLCFSKKRMGEFSVDGPSDAVKYENETEEIEDIYNFLLCKANEGPDVDEDVDIGICNEDSIIPFEAEIIDIVNAADVDSTIDNILSIQPETGFEIGGWSDLETDAISKQVVKPPLQQSKLRKWKKVETPIKTLEGEFSVLQWAFEDICAEPPLEEVEHPSNDIVDHVPFEIKFNIQLNEPSTDDTKSDQNLDLSRTIAGYCPERPEACQFPNCSKKFRDKTGLRKHQKTHGPRLHICAECGKAFLESSKLKRHRLVHTGEQPYQCNWCNKRFALAFNLKTHLRVHTGEKPFGCQFAGCQRRFAQSTNLKYHELTHIREFAEVKGNKRQQIRKISKRRIN